MKSEKTGNPYCPCKGRISPLKQSATNPRLTRIYLIICSQSAEFLGALAGLRLVAHKQSVTARRFRTKKKEQMRPISGLAILARRDPLTEEEWQDLIAARLDALKPHLRHMTLRPLGEIQMIHDYFGTHGLGQGNPIVTHRGGMLDLEMRGIFPNDENWANVASRKETHEKDDFSTTFTTHRFWGLTRQGQWIAIEVQSTTTVGHFKEGRRATYTKQKANTVYIETLRLAEIPAFCSRSLRDIWNRLGEVAKEWAKHRKDLYEKALRLEETVLREEALLGIVPLK